MQKKHVNRFSLVFNPYSEHQAFAIEKLNSLPPRTLAVYLSEAVYAFEHRTGPRRKKSAKAKSETRKKAETFTDVMYSVQHAAESESEPLSHISHPEQTEITAKADRNEPLMAADLAMLTSMMSFLDSP